MYQPVTVFLALRSALSRRRLRFVSIVSLASMLGIALSTAALVIVMSVMNGFEHEVARHLLGVTGHAIVVHPSGQIADPGTTGTEILSHPAVAGVTAYVRGNAMVSRGNQVRGVLVEGVQTQHIAAVVEVDGYIEPEALARLAQDPGTVIIGQTLADELDVGHGGLLSLVVPNYGPDGRVQRPRYRQFEIVGEMRTGLHQFDSRLLLIRLDQAQSLFGLNDRVSGLRLRLQDPRQAPRVAVEISKSLNDEFHVIDWTRYQKNFFVALQSQKRLLFVILILVTAVAAFNIAANMIIVVAEKGRDIAILRTLGASRSQVVRLFLIQGMLIGLIGTAAGIALGVLGTNFATEVARLIEQIVGLDLINPDVYFIDYLPTELKIIDVATIVAATITIALGASAYPALRAARIDPATGVRQD